MVVRVIKFPIESWFIVISIILHIIRSRIFPKMDWTFPVLLWTGHSVIGGKQFFILLGDGSEISLLPLVW